MKSPSTAKRRAGWRAKSAKKRATEAGKTYHKAKADAFRKSEKGRAYFSAYRATHAAERRFKRILRPIISRRSYAALLIQQGIVTVSNLITLPAGSLKLIFENSKAAVSNKQRLQSGGKRLKPAFYVAVVNDDGSLKETYAANITGAEVTLMYAPDLGGIAKRYPAAVQALRRADVPTPGIWLETRGPLTLSLTPAATADGESEERDE